VCNLHEEKNEWDVAGGHAVENPPSASFRFEVARRDRFGNQSASVYGAVTWRQM